MIKVCIFVCVFVCALLLPGLSYGVIESPRKDGLYYYKIGGGRHISIPPSLTIHTLNLSLNEAAMRQNS